MTWPERPVIYEVNVWPWLHDLARQHGRVVTLADVPESVWDDICLPGIDTVWLMGIWERSPSSRDIALVNANNRASFEAALPDLDVADDVVGSAYSVRQFVVDARLGGRAGLAAARAQLAARNVHLLLDFVPNHVAPDHPWISEHPEFFVAEESGALAAGRDPYFPPWDDTVQVNAFSMALRRVAATTLLDIAAQCDGVRCDMAMLLLNHVFARTWDGGVGWAPPGEYWTDVIGSVRKAHPRFVFIAEAYWDLEAELQRLGFDFCYDKRLYDRLVSGDAASIRDHLAADLDFQQRLVRFAENHDEPRAAAVLAPARQRAAAVVVATLPGATLWHEGQIDGRRVHVPVFLVRRPDEPADATLRAFYQRLLACDVRVGRWELCSCDGWPDNPSAERLLAWSWTDDERRALVVVNFSAAPAQGRVRLPWDDVAGRRWCFADVIDGVSYEYDGDDLAEEGLFVDRAGWACHVFRAAAG